MNRFAYVVSAYVASMTMAIMAFVHPIPRLVWNASASIPIGLYWLEPGTTLRSGDLVAISPPRALGAYMAGRRYLPSGLPLLKHIAARTGQRVCRFGGEILVDQRPIGRALDQDSRGRPLPAWRGCMTLAAGQLFLMNAGVRDSFDGRYFGAIPAATITGRLTPIWTR